MHSCRRCRCGDFFFIRIYSTVEPGMHYILTHLLVTRITNTRLSVSICTPTHPQSAVFTSIHSSACLRFAYIQLFDLGIRLQVFSISLLRLPSSHKSCHPNLSCKWGHLGHRHTIMSHISALFTKNRGRTCFALDAHELCLLPSAHYSVPKWRRKAKASTLFELLTLSQPQ